MGLQRSISIKIYKLLSSDNDLLSMVVAINLFSLVVSASLSGYSLRIKNNKSALLFGYLMAIFALWSLVKLIMALNPVLSVVIPGSQFIFAISSFTSVIILHIVIAQLNYPRWFKKSHVVYLFATLLCHRY